jgi:hypothetical protein
MEADAFNNRADKLRLAGFQLDVEKHSRSIRVLKRAAVAVKPGSENNAV